jgi:hypothetical protein
MLDNIKNIFNLERNFYVVGVSNREGELGYSLLTIALENEELKIEDRYTANDLSEDFLERLSKDYPVLLYVEGDTIINKIVENKIGYRNDLIFKANPEDFYFYEYHQDNKVYASVCRKVNIDVHIDAIEKHGRFVFNVTFGPFVMANVLPLLKDYSSIASKHYNLDLADGKVLDFQNKTDTNQHFKIIDETFNEEEVPLFATFFNHKYPSNSIEVDVKDFSTNTSEFKFKKGFKIAGIFTLVFIMGALLISHFLKEYYEEQLMLKKVSYSSTQKLSTDINNLKGEVLLKERILLENRINNKNFITKYISELSNSVPDDITLKTISVFPGVKKVRKNEKINFQSNTILIEGEATRDDTFNAWVKQIKNFEWITAFEITEYNQFDKKTNTFKIETKL